MRTISNLVFALTCSPIGYCIGDVGGQYFALDHPPRSQISIFSLAIMHYPETSAHVGSSTRSLSSIGNSRVHGGWPRSGGGHANQSQSQSQIQSGGRPAVVKRSSSY